jgi:hypothetical protein
MGLMAPESSAERRAREAAGDPVLTASSGSEPGLGASIINNRSEGLSQGAEKDLYIDGLGQVLESKNGWTAVLPKAPSVLFHRETSNRDNRDGHRMRKRELPKHPKTIQTWETDIKQDHGNPLRIGIENPERLDAVFCLQDVSIAAEAKNL